MLLIAILLVDFKVPFSFIEMMAEGGSSIVFDSSDPTIKNDLNVIIHQYLVEQQFISAANAIQSELSQRNIDTITKRLLAYDATTLISKSRKMHPYRHQFWIFFQITDCAYEESAV